MPTKYDTNPLDPDFPEKARAAAEALPTKTLPYAGAETRRFTGGAVTEEQTRRFASPDVSAYSSGYNGSYAPMNYAGAGASPVDRSSSRKVDKVGLPENVLLAVPYIPWYIGLVAGLLVLLFVPKSETKVRFYAAQGLAAHIGILIVTAILGFVGEITGVANFGNVIFQLVTSVMLTIFAIKAWRGKPVHIAAVDGLTNWLEEKIGPVKSES